MLDYSDIIVVWRGIVESGMCCDVLVIQTRHFGVGGVFQVMKTENDLEIEFTYIFGYIILG